MGRLRPVLLVAGAVLAIVGLFWIGQGLGYIRWPASSFMLGRPAWTNYGSVTAVAGLAMILIARRLRR